MMAKKKEWIEAELRVAFNLERISGTKTLLMEEWLDVSKPEFNVFEQHTFEDVYSLGVKNMINWSEGDLKMKFLSRIVMLGNMIDEGNIVTLFDKPLKGIVNGTSLSVKSYFMMAKGFMNIYQTPYFHFQAGGVPQYKPERNPTGDSMAQLLEAFFNCPRKKQGGRYRNPIIWM